MTLIRTSQQRNVSTTLIFINYMLLIAKVFHMNGSHLGMVTATSSFTLTSLLHPFRKKRYHNNNNIPLPPPLPVASNSSDTFPSPETASHFAQLSSAVYHMKRCPGEHHHVSKKARLPPGVNCHQYISNKLGTELIIVSSDLHRYVAVCFAGTDNVRDVLHDIDIKKIPFRASSPEYGSVHAGFHRTLFGEGLYDKHIKPSIQSLLEQHPDYTVYTTGHSLGGAAAVMAGVSLVLDLPKRPSNNDDDNDKDLIVHSLSYGTPMTGDEAWKDFVDREMLLNNRMSVWRFVYERDLIPRAPLTFYHVGHTVQLDRHQVSAYYWHYGNKEQGYEGVPKSWASATWLVPVAGYDHESSNYVEYLQKKSTKNEDKYWTHDFVNVRNRNQGAAPEPLPVPNGQATNSTKVSNMKALLAQRETALH